jgi:hypothetical protein
LENERIHLPDSIKQAIETLGLNTFTAFQELDASHIQKIKSILLKQKRNFNIETQKILFTIKNKIRTQKTELFSALDLQKHSDTEEVVVVECAEMELPNPNESSQMVIDSSMDQSAEQKTLDPEFLAKLEDEDFCTQIISKLDNNLKRYIYKFTEESKIEDSTLVVAKGKLQGRSKCPECGGVFVVQADVRRLKVKWIPSNMRKHYNRHFKITPKEEGLKSEAAGSGQDTASQDGSAKLIKSPKKEKTSRTVKLIVPKRIVPKMKVELLNQEYAIEIPEPVEEAQFDEIMAEQSMQEEEEQYDPNPDPDPETENEADNENEESQEETEHEDYQNVEDHGEQYFEEEILDVDDEELESQQLEPEPEIETEPEPAHKRMKREPMEYSVILDAAETMEMAFSQPQQQQQQQQTQKKRSFHSIEEDDPDWLYCKTICAMMKTMPLDIRNQLKIEILTLTSQKQYESMNK